MSPIRLRGLRAGNLCQLDLDLEHGRWTAVHGPSGAGKTALLFRTLEPVARQRFRVLEDARALPGSGESWLRHVGERIEGLQPVVAAAGEVPRGRRATEVGTALDLWTFLVQRFRSAGQRRCLACSHQWAPLRVEELVEEVKTAPTESTVHLFTSVDGGKRDALLEAGWTRVRLGEKGLARLEECPEVLPPASWLLLDRLRWRPGQEARLHEACAEALRRRAAVLLEVGGETRAYAAAEVCPQCAVLQPPRPWDSLHHEREAEDLVLAERSWRQWCEAPLADWLRLDGHGRARRRLEYLERTRLGHLAANRTLGTLSLGEGRRLELVALLSQLRCGQLALFDEPGMGLHGNERRALAGLLRELVEQGNTVLTADPAREFLEAADHWLMLGPGGGADGGQVTARGPRGTLPDEARWQPSAAQPPRAWLDFRKLRTRFLDVPRLRLPLGRLVALAGVSGSGKTTLLEEELVPRLRAEKGYRGTPPVGGVTVLLERALGSSAFSTVATLSGAWSEVREAFASGEEGRIRGLDKSDLVARRDRGGCPDCGGHGVDANALPCDACAGLGLREDLLDLRLRQRSLRQWLTTPLNALEKRLPSSGRLRGLVSHLSALGLGTRTLGERGRHLSLGERSRLALARALAAARRDRPRLFLLDEPCLGLPFDEALKVVELLRSLCAQGHAFWVVEHHEVLLRSADWLVELGPGAGPQGGQLLYDGDPAGLHDADTPTAHWLRSRAAPAAPPPPPPPPQPIRCEALAEDLARPGRRRLEADLLRELSTRSPLLRDLAGGEEELQSDAAALAPTAWPVAPAPETSLLQVLGLQRVLRGAVQREGESGCPQCGGVGAWRDLAQALAEGGPAGDLLFTCPLHLQAATAVERASGDEGVAGPDAPGVVSGDAPGAADGDAALLLAAGFRRVLRGGKGHSLGSEHGLQQDDEVWLDRFDPAQDSGGGRVQDLEHHAGLLGGGWVHARHSNAVAGPPRWSYRSGACRDCGVLHHGRAYRLGGRSLEQLEAMRLQDCLAHLQKHQPELGLYAECAELLAGTSLLAHAGSTAWRALRPLEARVARLAGWLLQPLEGVVLLWEEPLSGLPPALARRLCARILALPPGCALRFTDPEGYADEEHDRSGGPRRGQRAARAPSPATDRPAPTAPSPATDPPAPLSRIEAFPLNFDLDGWAQPRLAASTATLREALDLTDKLRQQFLRTEEARLAGWSIADLGRGRHARVCPECSGRGGHRLHPRLLHPCPLCGGSGWSRETAVLEDRGLRWPDLGAVPLQQLLEHYQASPPLARTLQLAVEAGLGGLALDTPLQRLPRGMAALAPILAALAQGEERAPMCWAAPASGLNHLEVGRLLSTIEVFASTQATSISPNWRDHHPALSG